MQQVDIVKILEALKKVELRLKDLYDFYNKYFYADRAVSGCFFELALDEKAHADLIDYQLRSIRRNRAMFNDVEFDMKELDSFTSRIDACINSKEAISPRMALDIAVELENSAVEYHYATLMNKSNPDVGALVQRLASADNIHASRLKELAAEYTG